MELKIDTNGIWYHGSNMVFSEMKKGSTITQWKELAEAFSHKPSLLSYDDNGTIYHNGTEKGYLYIIDEPITVGKILANAALDALMNIFVLKEVKGNDFISHE